MPTFLKDQSVRRPSPHLLKKHPATQYAQPTAHLQRAIMEPSRLTTADVLYLQRTAGNRAVAQLLATQSPRQVGPASGSSAMVQRSLQVGPADDRYEREADEIAQSVLGTSSSRSGQAKSPTAPSVQREPVGPEGGQLQGDVESRLRQTQSSGSLLPDGVRSQLEAKLNADLGQVKVHTDKQAVQLTQEMGAKAFTHQNHIYYGKGHSPSDLKLTAHEAVHTIQQGAVSQNAQRLPDTKVAQTTKPAVSRASAHIQRWPWDKKNRRKRNMTDRDLDSITRGGSGTANRVDKVIYNRNIGKSGQKVGFFKPNEVEGRGQSWQREKKEMGDRAVASSRLDKWLGTNVLSEEIWAQHAGEDGEIESGSVSAQVEGSPLLESVFNKEMPEDFELNPDTGDLANYKNVNGRWYERTGLHYNDHDFSNPLTQKGMSDLQLLDAITHQKDRHGGNIFIDPTTGKVKGIDNDRAFGKNPRTGPVPVDELNDKYLGLPSLVDEETANKILKKKAKNLRKVLGSKYGGRLHKDEIKKAQARMRAVKAYLKKLKKENKLVKKWDNMTYDHSLMEKNKKGIWDEGPLFEPSYLKRSVMQYAGAVDRDVRTKSMDLNELNDDELIEQMTVDPDYYEDKELV